MAGVVLTKGLPNDGSLARKILAFLGKLTENDESPGLHVEPITGSADSRVRTGRVDKQYRAVMFKLVSDGETQYVIEGVYNHDDAIAKAKTTILTTNPVNGMAEFRLTDEREAQSQAEIERKLAQAAAQERAEAAQLIAEAERVAAAAIAEAEAAKAAAATPEPASEAPVESEPELDEADAEPLPPLLNHSVADLTGTLGLREWLAHRVVDVRTDTELVRLAEEVRGWEHDALIALGTGMSIPDVMATLGLNTVDTAKAGQSDDDVVLASIRTDAARSQFAYIEDNDELRRIIEGDDFAAWRVFLHPEQRKFVKMKANGPYRVTGGAGTGKTVVLVHRARELWRRYPGSRIVMTTFTKNLASELRDQIRQLDARVPIATQPWGEGVFVLGVDALVQSVLREAGANIEPSAVAVLGAGGTSFRTKPMGHVWREVSDEATSSLPTELCSPTFLESEYNYVVLPNGITTEREYLKVRRPGRGVALNRASRAAVWKAITEYKQAARAAGAVSFEEASAMAAHYLRRLAETGTFVADHVLVDEGQDLKPTHWLLLRALSKPGPDDMSIAEDIHQRIYGAKLTLSHYGIDIVGRARQLKLNYRTTAQNLKMGVDILSGVDYGDGEGEHASPVEYRSARNGPKPRVIRCDHLTDELDRVAREVKTWIEKGIEPGSIGILVRQGRDRDRIVAGLNERGCKVRGVDGDALPSDAPAVMTMHRAKGTEFSRVVVMGVSDRALPAHISDRRMPETDREDALLRERSLLYVAATRARDELILTYAGNASELLPAAR